MNRLISVFVVSILVCGSWLAAGYAQEQVANPIYANWAKFKLGTSVKYIQESEMMGNKTESEIIYKLVELSPEKAVVEMSGTMMVMGSKTPMPTTKMEHFAQVPVTPQTPQSSANTDKPQLKQSDEDMEVLGAKMKVHVTETTILQGDSPIVSKVWSNDEIPGTLIKSETKMEKPIKSVTRIILMGKDIK